MSSKGEKKKLVSKNKKKREKRKQKKIENDQIKKEDMIDENQTLGNKENEKELEDDIVVDYILPSRPLELENDVNKNFDSYQKVFEKFYSSNSIDAIPESNNNQDTKDGSAETKQKKGEEKKEEENRLTKKERKEQKRLKVSILKQLTDKPAIVEAHDVTSSDPLMLVFLKSYRNSVPVPRHWLRKRKYLQGKRGSEKKPYKLPKYISDTGIIDLREAAREKDQQKTAKQKARERVQPKLLKGEIDYQSLHDAFFVHQTKPPLTFHGDLYYEGKEFDVVARSRIFRPGFISNKLREALGMQKLTLDSDDPSPQNEQALAVPPPWLFSMQRWGPPPSYPKIKIPGVTSPLPPSARWGFNPGQWGKPPVDDLGNPLWGDLFRNLPPPIIHHYIEDTPEEQKRFRFGELTSESNLTEDMVEEEENQEEVEEEKEQEKNIPKKDSEIDFVNQIPEKDENGDITIGIQSSSSLVPSEPIDLRKDQQEPKQLYQLLEKQTTNVSEKGIYGSSHKYLFNTSSSSTQDKVPIIKNLETEKQIITIDPNELESLENKSSRKKLLQEKYDEKVSENRKDFKKHSENKNKDKYKDNFKF